MSEKQIPEVRRKALTTRILIIILASMLMLTGCQTGSRLTELLEQAGIGAGAEPETEGEPDRYDEIVDRTDIKGKLAVYFLDLDSGCDEKSGDSTLLISPDGKVMLIDAGYTTCGEDIAVFLRELGITRIDYLVASHPHADHIGGIPDIVENVEIGIHYRSTVEYTTKTYENYVEAIDEADIPVEYLSEGDSFLFGELIKVEVFNPGEEIVYPEGFPDGSTQFLNDNSLLMKLTYGESTALFGGDIYLDREAQLVERYGELLDVDVVKENHHGSDTSNSRNWVRNITPEIVVGIGDDLGAMSVYLYYKQDAAFYHTAYDGHVRIIMDDKQNYEVTAQFDSWLR